MGQRFSRVGFPTPFQRGTVVQWTEGKEDPASPELICALIVIHCMRLDKSVQLTSLLLLFWGMVGAPATNNPEFSRTTLNFRAAASI